MIDGEAVLLLKRVLWLVFLPPNGLVTLALLCMVVAQFSARWRRSLLNVGVVSLLALYAIVSPPGSKWLSQQVERRAGPVLDEQALTALLASASAPQAIVILGGGMAWDERDKPYPGRVSGDALERVAVGVRLARQSKLPVLASGGKPFEQMPSEARLLARAVQHYGVPVRWLEEQSRDTAGNAWYSSQLLRADGIDRIILVTQAMHMPRARRIFEATGLQVTGAPHGFMAQQGVALRDWFLPSNLSVKRGAFALHELIGGIWYRFKSDAAATSSSSGQATMSVS